MFHVPGFIDARLEVVGEKENGPLACLPRARPFSLSPIACVASVSISNYCAKVRAGAKKIGRRGRGEEVPSFPSSFPVIPFFCSPPDVLDELARKRLLPRLFRPLLPSTCYAGHSHTNPSNFRRPLQSLLLRYMAENLQVN